MILQATDRPAACFARPAIGRFHQAGAAARHDGEADSRKAAPDEASQLVERMLRPESGRSEHRHARPHEVEHPEAPEKVHGRSREQQQFLGTGVRPLKQDLVGGARIRRRCRRESHQ
jgi:hypothetical protein